MFIIEDTDGTKWRVEPRACYKHLKKKEFLSLKHKTAESQRRKGRADLADAIERKSTIAWLSYAGYITWKKRVASVL